MSAGRVALAVLVLAASAARATEGDEKAYRFIMSGYGDVVYSRFDYGPDQKSGPNGSPPDHRAVVDLAFFTTELEYYFRPSLYVEAEIEFEHGGTGSALELEFEEFGEFEVDVETGGEVRIEELHITRVFASWLNLRVGRFITAVGLLNDFHRPTQYFGTRRSETEVSLIPTTWDETGVELFGALGRVTYTVQLVSGLDSSGFSSKFWVVGGHQKKFEEVRATDMALVGRLDLYLVDGWMMGASYYYGNTTQNRPKPDMEGIDGHLAIADVHTIFDLRPLRGRAMALYGMLENADIISAKNGRLSTNLQVSRTPVAKAAFGWYGEIGLDVAWFFGRAGQWQLYPFFRYEHFDTMHEVDDGIFDEPRFEREIVTTGINFFPHPDVVVKMDFSHRTLGAARFNDENTISIDVGFSTVFFGL